MDGWRVRPSMAVIPQKPDRLIDIIRPNQLELSEKRNGVPFVCTSRTRQISSGHKSSTASQSPTVSSKSNFQEQKLRKRSQSADRRRRPSNPSSRPSNPACDLAGRSPDGDLPSMESLSLSSAVSERKSTAPQNKKTSELSENARPVDDLHGRTALGLRSRKVSGNISKSNSLITPSKVVIHGRIHDSHVTDEGYKQMRGEVERAVTRESCMSISSPHLRRSEKAFPVRKPSRRSSFPTSISHDTLLLNKTLLKEMRNPFSEYNSTKSGACSMPSVLNYTVEVRRGKQSSKRIEDAHQLRILYNRFLQWRFVNAVAEDSLSVQRIRAETTLYDMENVSSDLCDPFVQKRIYMQRMKEGVKLKMLLKEQITHLEDWCTIEHEHSITLSGTIRALRASSLWIPATEGAKVDIKSMKNAINSAVDEMQGMGSSICYLSFKVDQVNSLISDLLASARKEKLMLDKCRELLTFVGELQVQNSSLRGRIMQLGQVLCK